MKNLTLSLIALLAINTLVMAESYPAYGPDSYKAITTGQPNPDPKYPNETGDNYYKGNNDAVDTGFYLGLAYGSMNGKSDVSASQPIEIQATSKIDLNPMMLQIGYQFDKYMAIEGRYWNALGEIDITGKSSTHPQLNDSFSVDSDDENAFGIYVKPMYPVAKGFDVYALFGYANIDDFSEDDSGFSWGVGTKYNINEYVSVFIDYVRLYEDESTDEIFGNDINYDLTLDSLNFGITYKF